MTDEIENPIDLAISREAGTGTIEEPTYSGILSFARRRYSKSLLGVDLAVVGIPFDLATTSRPGARLGPRAVRAASALIAWDRVHGWEYDPFAEISVVDYGDVYFELGLPDTIPDAIYEQFKQIHSKGVKTLMLGGDHFVTYPVLRSLAEVHQTPIALVHFDAHSDTWAEDLKTVNHGTMFYHAAKEGYIDPAKSIQLGIRTYNKEDHGFTVHSAESVRKIGVDAIVEEVLKLTNGMPVYITFDIDCLDPSVAPGTGTPVVGGLSSMEAQQILRGLRGINLIGADVVEVAPQYDVSEITSLAGATMAMNIVGLFAETVRASKD